MAKKALITVDGAYCKVKKGLITIDGTYCKIKKALITIGGVYRPCWSGGELAYYGTTTALGEARNNLAATTVGDYALFGGGRTGSTSGSNMVDAYNSVLTHSTPTALSIGRQDLAATTVGDYALFGGGVSFAIGVLASPTSSSVVDAYNKSLTHSTAAALDKARCLLAATTVGDYALFAGGLYKQMGNEYARDTVDAYNTSLTRSTPTALRSARYYISATTVGDYALFFQGPSSTDDVQVDVYNASLTRSSPPSWAGCSKAGAGAATVGGYAICSCGGDTENGYFTITDFAFDASLTTISLGQPDVLRLCLAATTVGNYAIFGGGLRSEASNAVHTYDASLTRTTQESLSVARGNLAATTVGNYALFGGGGASDVVDVYTVV